MMSFINTLPKQMAEYVSILQDENLDTFINIVKLSPSKDVFVQEHRTLLSIRLLHTHRVTAADRQLTR